MRPIVLRFVAMAALFAVWIAYLGYLVAFRPQSPNGLPIILSRPQFLVSTLDVVGVIDDDDRTLTAFELLKGDANGGEAAGLAVGPALQTTHTVRVVTLKDVLHAPNDRYKPGQVIGVHIPANPPAPWPEKLSTLGECLLPLRSLDGGLTWQVVPLPPSPGFNASSDYRIYPADAETLAQYKQIGKSDPLTPPG
jgi:hypothetical protein